MNETMTMWMIDWHRLGSQLMYMPKQPLLFNTGLFLFLFTAFLLFYTLLRRHTVVKVIYVIAFSYYFYYKNAGVYCLLLAFITLINYLSAIRMEEARSKRERIEWLVFSLVVTVGQLAYFKYTNFLLSSVEGLWHGSFKPLDIFLPIGISFFTFQTLSYVIDVYRGQLKAERNVLDFAFFVSFFPTLLAGPILRAKDFLPQVRRCPVVTSTMFGTGLFYIISGLFKKAVISDYISSNFVDRIFDNPSLYSGLENLLGIYGYTLQIYCDFSGYSDMAIGIALWMGFQIPANFRSPYKSDSITDFWRRWHISLSSWLRDYIYISLGGNRKGKIRMYFNLLFTMVLGGLWHGASWNFIVWGTIHGVALAGHKFLRSLLGKGKHDKSTGWRKGVAVVLTFHLVAFAWIFFANKTFDASMLMLERIATSFHAELLPQFLAGYPAVSLLIAVGYLLHFAPDSWSAFARQRVIGLPMVGKVVLLVVVVWLVIQVKGSDIQPFIYFKF